MAFKRKTLIAALAGLMIGQGALQAGLIHPKWSSYQPKESVTGNDSLDPMQIVLNLFGFREFLASMLWVRADAFFDQGQYDAVLPLINLCTLLDPHQIDIYSTGMWHIAYNFTDEEQRSDRRYVPSALALGKRGVRNNPDTYEVFFETGWIWYHKIDDDYHQAVKWFEMAHQRKDIIPARRNLLSNAYQRNNELDKALNLYFDLLSRAEEAYKKNPEEYQNHQIRDTIENNLDTMIVRLVQRGSLAEQRSPEEFRKGQYDASKPWDVQFSCKVTIEEPKVVRVEGFYNVLPVGTRLRLVIRDKDFEGARAAELDWDSRTEVELERSRTSTILQDQLFIKNRRFNRLIDMVKDPTMYPFDENSKEYLVEFYYNPRSAPPHLQDKFGYAGQGYTDSNGNIRMDLRKNYSFDGKEKDKKGYSIAPKLVELPGQQPVLYCSFTVTREQMLRLGDYSMDGGVVPVFKSKGFNPKAIAKVDDFIIDQRALRGGPVQTPYQGTADPAGNMGGGG